MSQAERGGGGGGWSEGNVICPHVPAEVKCRKANYLKKTPKNSTLFGFFGAKQQANRSCTAAALHLCRRPGRKGSAKTDNYTLTTDPGSTRGAPTLWKPKTERSLTEIPRLTATNRVTHSPTSILRERAKQSSPRENVKHSLLQVFQMSGLGFGLLVTSFRRLLYCIFPDGGLLCHGLNLHDK